jgi:hypothetical protein
VLLPHEVIPFLTHSDPKVRRHAAEYLAEAHDPAPATADDFWRVLDLYGFGQDEYPHEGALSFLAQIPSTDAGLTRLLEKLSSKPAEFVALHLVRALDRIPIDILKARCEELAASVAVPEDSKRHFEFRLDLASRPLEMLWDDLVQHAASIEGKCYGDFDLAVSERLIEALARHPDFSGPRAVEILRNKEAMDWREPFCMDLVGEMHYEPAADVLFEKLGLKEGDINDHAARALVRIGTPEIVRRTAELFPKQNWDFRLFATDVFKRIKRPESEAALLALLPDTQGTDIRTFLAMALCDLCSRAGVEIDRQMVVDKDYDEEAVELDESVLTTGKMVGYDPPEAAQWREKIAAREARTKKLLAGDDAALSKGTREMADEYGVPSGHSNRDFQLPESEDAPAPERRTAPRVGRNDPCPCGSGKKYKKCCLKEHTVP